ncbi:MAG: hypothetical protein PHN64_06535 [Desulfovibrionaceae bacterium]|nr:hypothetical protein [Desulfovibrionaceae bacterium]
MLDYRRTFAPCIAYGIPLHRASSGQVDMFVLQKLMTHDSPQMTQRYSHLVDDAMKCTAEVISLYFQQVANAESPVRKFYFNKVILFSLSAKRVKKDSVSCACLHGVSSDTVFEI